MTSAPDYLTSYAQWMSAQAEIQKGQSPTTAAMDPRLDLDTQQRVQEAQAHAQAVLPSVNSKLNQLGLREQFKALQSTKQDTHSGVKKLRQLASILSDQLTPLCACKRQCSDCCHGPVAVTAVEARVMAKALKVGLRAPGNAVTLTTATAFSRNIQGACPFLLEGRCSIYEHRPLACRTYLSLAPDNELCKLRPDGVPVPVPLVNLTPVQKLYLQLSDYSEVYDIRDFFPDGLKK